MVSASSDIQAFLSTHALFSFLSPVQLENLANNSYTAFNKAGDDIPLTRSDKPTGVFILRTGSMEIRDGQNTLLDRLSTGDFLMPALLDAVDHSSWRVQVLEDSLYYTIAAEPFRALVLQNDELARLCDGYARMFKTGTRARAPQAHTSATYLDQFVGEHMSSHLVCAGPEITVREAARLMSRQRVSSLLIAVDDQLQGILTDRDLRSRVLAEGVADTEAVVAVMTTNPICTTPERRLHEAQLQMMSADIHHLPVIENGCTIGMITLSDILKANNIEPLSLARRIKSAKNTDELGQLSNRLPELVVKLIEQDMRAVEVGEIISSLTDALTRRLLQMAESQFGPPPCRYSWLAFGSQARQEQMLVSDQDNALLLDDSYDNGDDDDYFLQLATFVNDGLNAAGIPWCPGGIMAKNTEWRMTLHDWKSRFTRWIDEPSPSALLHAGIFFDARRVYGDYDLAEALQHHVLQKARKNTIFLAMLSENALLNSPPLGFFKQFVLERDGNHNQVLDLKKRGTSPIAGIARSYALALGNENVNTRNRLLAAATRNGLSKALAGSLVDAHEFIAFIRLKAQCRKYRAGAPVDNFLDPQTLSPLVRHQLKEAFQTVREGQTALKMRMSGGAV